MAETPEERRARQLREYEVQGLMHQLYDPEDDYTADDAAHGKGE